MVDPGRPHLHPGFVTPVKAFVTSALEPFDIVSEFFGAIFTKSVRYVPFGLLIVIFFAAAAR